YVAPKENQKYASIGCSDWSQLHTKFVFDELAFISDDNFYHVFAHATEISNIEDFNNRSWKFDKGLVKFRVAKKDYEKEDKEKKKVAVAQSRLEKWVCKLFAEREEGVTYHGFINLQDDKYCELFVSGKDDDGSQIEPTMLARMEKMSATLEPVETVEHLSPEDFVLPTGKGGFSKGGFGGKGQTELEKLNDRVAFICTQVNAMSDCPAISDLGQLADLLEIVPNKKAIQKVFDLCIALIS
nr:hypothetical protein [Calothrix sp. FACHB-156]